MAKPKRTLQEWLKEVDKHLEAKCGLSHLDLPDCCYSDWYEDGKSPKSAAAAAIKNVDG